MDHPNVQTAISDFYVSSLILSQIFDQFGFQLSFSLSSSLQFKYSLLFNNSIDLLNTPFHIQTYQIKKFRGIAIHIICNFSYKICDIIEILTSSNMDISRSRLHTLCTIILSRSSYLLSDPSFFVIDIPFDISFQLDSLALWQQLTQSSQPHNS